MKRALISAFIVVSTLTASFASRAQGTLTVRQYREAKANEKMHVNLMFYLSGSEDGFSFSNATLKRKGHPRLYCQPDKLGINESLMESMIDKELNEATNPYGDADPIAAVFLFALQHTFPCK